jgi:hypothetical protein
MRYPLIAEIHTQSEGSVSVDLLYADSYHFQTVRLSPNGHAYFFEVNLTVDVRSFVLTDWTAADNTASWLRRYGYKFTVKSVLFEPLEEALDQLLGITTAVVEG